MEAVHGFHGDYRFLSNFYLLNHPITIGVDGQQVQCRTVEHAYQASKVTNIEDAVYVAYAETPGDAKRRGREIKCRKDWDDIKLKVMFDLLVTKFQDSRLAERLIATDPMELIEVNRYGDRFWGTDVHFNGDNNLDLLLMQVRDLLLSF